ncbi:hypothetical protein SLS62_000969 [Diatrype stigma]|uniref:Phospholipase/carboxylesterase/thioesterase domain-containing protein n=1 Tax=Diatrype stigma TaxID=117547 RepID=A0AAN9VB94_9PEZI
MKNIPLLDIDNMAADYPEPLVIEPLSQPHRQTFIILHGRGSSGEKFGPVLLNTPITTTASEDFVPSKTATPTPTPTPTTLASAFPHARFVFPSAARRRATVYRRAYTHQWFDNWKLDPPATAREELQQPGLRETTAYLHQLLRREIEQVSGGARNVVLGGLSQGQAAALTALLLWEGDPLAAAFGMCGWLPYAARLAEQLRAGTGAGAGGSSATGVDDETQLDSGGDGDDDFDPFERDDETADEIDPPSRAVSWLREELEVHRQEGNDDSRSAKFLDIPLFLGHGTEDNKVSILLGREASRCLDSIGVRARWREYQGLGHWYSGDMLQDIVNFVRSEAKWET